ncbi:TPA: dTDP-4-dehydrorhamnose reductase [bacterium]|nr:dTDP-4-dehydrorhamnose reductase [bacterium]
MKFLITGANGQLAKEFPEYLKDFGHEFCSFDRENLDISNIDSVLEKIENNKPDIVLNCAAYNFVDRAEDDYETALRVNAEGVMNLAIACKKNNTMLVHYSTDYIFDGLKKDFYNEDDEPNPLNKYGQSKLLGEKYLQDTMSDFLLFRVSWVFGGGRQNFLSKLLDWAKNNKVLNIVCDQISIPTYTKDIVSLTLFAINKRLRGIYHLTNSGYASRYEVARYFIEHSGLENLVLPANSKDFPSSAKRPFFSAMSNKKLSEALNVEIPDWRTGIDRYIETIYKKEDI